MSKTIEFGAFIASATGTRLAEAQRVASDLGVSVSSDGSPFAGSGGGAPVKVIVQVPDGTVLNREAIIEGRHAFDDLLTGSERLTDYAVVKENGVTTEVVSLLTAEVKPVQSAPAARPAPAAPAAPARPRRWSPFGR